MWDAIQPLTVESPINLNPPKCPKRLSREQVAAGDANVWSAAADVNCGGRSAINAVLAARTIEDGRGVL